MTAEATQARPGEPDVDPAKRALLLHHLGSGHGMAISLHMADLDRKTGRALADAWGWPDKAAIRVRYLQELGGHVPAPRAPEPAPPADPGSGPAVEDHPAVERALTLARVVRDQDHQAVARLTGDWSEADRFEVMVALAALLPIGVEPHVALEWLDREPGEWPPAVVVVEAARWDAGARDATAVAACEERGRRGLS